MIKTKNTKVGRPKTQIDYNQVRKLAEIMCTQEEIASVIGCDVRTLQRDEEFSRVYKIGKDNGKMSLRRKQWKLADHNSSMAIFLGKNILGQRDVAVIDAEITTNNPLKELTTEEIREYIQAYARANKDK